MTRLPSKHRIREDTTVKRLFPAFAATLLMLCGPALAADKDARTVAQAAAAQKAPMSADKIDLNTATETELAALSGIGDARAKAIVKGRPYKGKDELVERKIVPQSVYDKIKDKVIARQGK
jgi:DNA uptake protein ComE-like DNA-binding protein